MFNTTAWVAVAIVSFLLGRSLLITSMLRKKVQKRQAVIDNLREAYSRTDEELLRLKGELATIYAPFPAFRRRYFIKSFKDLHVVYMQLVPSKNKAMDIPIKVFFDEEDPEFALHEAEEFIEKCREE